ncbi:MAG TPA: hypothetical protein VFV87_07185 [Pirellulaceae bacterium]|nr:hypothetical protein [Pirellulaceae bacterium]
MNSGCLHVAALAGLAALAGCSGPQVRAHIDSVNAEYRQLEDYVYVLEDENARLQRRIDHVQDNYERALRGEAPRRPGPFERRTDGSGDADSLSPPTIEGGTPMEPPTIEIPGRSTTQRPELDSKSAPSSGRETLDLSPPAAGVPDASDGHSPETGDLPTPAVPRQLNAPAPEVLPKLPADPQVTHLFLNPLMTGGADFDRQPGDEGLSIVLEPRNAADEYVPQAGAVSVVVLDPARQGEAARIARWDFTLSATQQKLQDASAAPGICLEMPWPASPPTNNRLKLYVRYETADGRQLQTDREIFITPPGQLAQRWTPRPPDRLQAPAAAPQTSAPATSPPASVISQLPAAESAPKLLQPPAALSSEAPQKLAAPQWSPYR